ncbi:MAG: nuclear transport factor 2 family protein, partial [Bacteroidales bacterium]
MNVLMKFTGKTLSVILFMLFAFSIQLFAQSEGNPNDESAIKKVIQSAYIDGIHNLGAIQDIQDGFHPGFELLIKTQDQKLTELPIYTWIESVEQRKAQNPNGPEEKTTVEFLDVDVTGDAAMAKIDLFKGGNKIFTDYLFLYKFNNDWRIVSKI